MINLYHYIWFMYLNYIEQNHTKMLLVWKILNKMYTYGCIKCFNIIYALPTNKKVLSNVYYDFDSMRRFLIYLLNVFIALIYFCLNCKYLIKVVLNFNL